MSKIWSTEPSPDTKLLNFDGSRIACNWHVRAGNARHLVPCPFVALISAAFATCVIPVLPIRIAHSLLPSHTAFHAGKSCTGGLGAELCTCWHCQPASCMALIKTRLRPACP